MFLSQNSLFTKKLIILVSIIIAIYSHPSVAQNRYGASADLHSRMNVVEGTLQNTAGKVGKLEGDVQSIKQHIGYTKRSNNNAAVATTKVKGISHLVVAGETLSSISRRYKVGVDRLVAENQITNPNTLHPGQEIFIPGQKGSPAIPKAIPVSDPPSTRSAMTHTVRVGDTLSSIARKFGVSTTSIAIANRLLDPNAIRIGQKLDIPDSTTPTTPLVAKTETHSTPPKPSSPPRPQSTQGGEMVAPDGYGFYQIEPGDTLHSIAISFGTNPNELRILNDFPPNSNSLRIGDYLLVPVPDDTLFES